MKEEEYVELNLEALSLGEYSGYYDTGDRKINIPYSLFRESPVSYNVGDVFEAEVQEWFCMSNELI